MPDAATVADRKERGVCTRCGKRPARKKPKATKCQQCIDKTSSATIAAQRAEPEKYAEIQRERYAAKERYAVCIRCDDLATPGRKRCEKHLAEAREATKKSRKRTP